MAQTGTVIPQGLNLRDARELHVHHATKDVDLLRLGIETADEASNRLHGWSQHTETPAWIRSTLRPSPAGGLSPFAHLADHDASFSDVTSGFQQ